MATSNRHSRTPNRAPQLRAASILRDVASFEAFGSKSVATDTRGIPTFVNEFWTAKQRAASSLHEISYRACFKPQLPRFFIERLTNVGDVVGDPFMGRGTTLIEAALLGREAVGCDVNPLSEMLVTPRLSPPTLDAIRNRLDEIDLSSATEVDSDLHVFFHPKTLQHICALREYFLRRQALGTLDAVDAWLRMVAVNRLTGHSPGFLSVYTLPPNQAVSVASQTKINSKRQQVPEYRDLHSLLLRKSAALLKDVSTHVSATLTGQGRARCFTTDAWSVPALRDSSVQLFVTSPPFLDVVDYAKDNWLRGWFCGIDVSAIQMTVLRDLAAWKLAMSRALAEMRRTLMPGGFVAFEVGEVRGGALRLEDAVIPCGLEAGLDPVLIMINAQDFTKTANVWGISNGTRGTNTNRIVLFQKQTS